MHSTFLSRVFSQGKAINGNIDPRFNQGMDWFISSKFYTANIPIHFMCFNNVVRLSIEEIKSNPQLCGIDIDAYKRGDTVVLFYANEVYLNCADTSSELSKIQTILNFFNIPLKDIIMIANIYEHNKTFTNIAISLGLKTKQIILIDYYELQTFFFHNVFGCDYSKKFNPNATKDLTFIFGKTDKLIRIIAMHQLWKQNMLDNAVTGCLIDPSNLKNDIEKIAKSAAAISAAYNKPVLQAEITEMLLKYNGSPDNARYLYLNPQNGAAKNHCSSYPYDHKVLFTDSRVSLIPETNYHFNQAHFITEKTYKAIYNHHPFTILGTAGLMKVLRSKGYKTFAGVCDEIYDQCANDRKRVELVINATNQLMKSPKHEEIDTITKHNFAQLEKNALVTVEQLNNIILHNFS